MSTATLEAPEALGQLNRQVRRRLTKIAPNSADVIAEMLLEEARPRDNLNNGGTERPSGVHSPHGGMVRLPDGVDLSMFLEALAAESPEYPGGLYPSYHQLLLDRGTRWSSEEVTVPSFRPWLAGITRDNEDEIGRCHEAAFHAAEARDYRYVEGWSLVEMAPEGQTELVRLAVYHTWCYDPDTGGAVEAYWPEAGSEYLGIVYDMNQVYDAFSTTRHYGMMGMDYLNCYHLLRRGLLGIDHLSKGDG